MTGKLKCERKYLVIELELNLRNKTLVFKKKKNKVPLSRKKFYTGTNFLAYLYSPFLGFS